MAGDIVSGDEGNPFVRPQERAEHPNGRRFPGSVRSQESVDLAPSHREVDAVNRSDRAKPPHQASGQDCGVCYLRLMDY
jgi:hypothetical protein